MSSVRPHVIPVGNGEAFHIACHRCYCAPRLGEQGMVVHNSHDGRESREPTYGPNPNAAWVIVLEDLRTGLN